MHTPWGPSQHVDKVGFGITFVSTAGHGGLMITHRVAEQCLPDHICAIAIRTSKHFAFEEDAAFAVPAYYLAKNHPDMLAGSDIGRRMLGKEYQDSLHLSLSRWYPDIYQSLGGTPDPEKFADWQLSQKLDKMRANSDPDLVTSAWGSWDTFVPNCVRVSTADDGTHFLTEASYEQRKAPLVSLCEPFGPLPPVEQRLAPYLESLVPIWKERGTEDIDGIVSRKAMDFAAKLRAEVPGLDVQRQVVRQLLALTNGPEAVFFKELPCLQGGMTAIVEQLRQRYPSVSASREASQSFTA